MASKSKKIGTIGEQVLITEFVKNGVPVLLPVGDNEPFDMVVIIDGRFLKVQVKTTETIKNVAMIFCTNITNPFKKTSRKYTETEIDLFGLYCIENGYIGLLPIKECTSKETIIRLVPPKNNQSTKIKNAETYEFDVQFKKL